MLNLAQLAAMTYQPFMLASGRAVLARQRLAAVNGALADPMGDGQPGDVEFE